MHQIDTNFKLPPYNYKSLRKGLTCAVCQSFKVTVKDKNLVCAMCNHQELVDTSILRAVEEIKLLFPGEKITTIRVYDWCRVIPSIKTIRRVLIQNYNVIGKKEYQFLDRIFPRD